MEQSELRCKALELAVVTRDPFDKPQRVAEAADIYFKFLNGQPAKPIPKRKK